MCLPFAEHIYTLLLEKPAIRPNGVFAHKKKKPKLCCLNSGACGEAPIFMPRDSKFICLSTELPRFVPLAADTIIVYLLCSDEWQVSAIW